ncbi:MAG: perosamine synthetase [Myxococcota bacterium]|jgi:perosamine synthetase
MNRVPLTRPTLGAEELAEISTVLDSGMLVQSRAVAELEIALSQAVNISPLIACSSGTSAIHLAVAALDLGPGDEVIVPDFCFPSVASAVIFSGATPVLCDVDPDSFNMDIERVSAAFSPKTRAILAVHQFGIPVGATAIQAAFDVPVIEDAACALGGHDDGGPCGGQTDLGCFSLHPRKIITTAEGGMVFARDPELAERIRALRNHGMARGDDGWEFVGVGFPYRMSEVHAAIGLGQLPRLEGILAGRRRAALAYRDRLAEIDSVVTCDALWQSGRVYQGMVVRLKPHIDRNAMIAHLRSDGIEATIGTYAIHRQSQLARHARISAGGLEGSVLAAEGSITLPLFPEMTDSDVDRVVTRLKAGVGTAHD